MGTSVHGEIYLRSIARRWRREANPDVERLQVLSPYITSAADSVLKNIGDGVAEIYTLFDAELFATGASSLRSLKKLHLAGHRLYALPKLHAKILMVPGSFASIGSQNLTRGGMLNKEASVALTDAVSLARIQKRIASWVEERVPIPCYSGTTRPRQDLLVRWCSNMANFERFLTGLRSL
jgi:phosphatidylserine/phosphatidylglycerophosphate/cardiolipin synthase-like enzyme